MDAMDHISQLDNRLPSKNASFLNLIREIPKRYIKVILIYENNWCPQRIQWTSWLSELILEQQYSNVKVTSSICDSVGPQTPMKEIRRF